MGSSARGKIVKATALLMALELLSQGIGLLRQMLTAAKFGTSQTMDAYLVALTVVGLIQFWVTLPMNQILVPLFRHDLSQRGEQAAWTNVGTLLNNLVLVLAGIVLVGWVLAPYLVDFAAPGFMQEAGALTTTLVRITVVSVIFVGVGEVLSQLLLSYERFVLPGLVGGVEQLIVVLGLLVFTQTYGIYGLAFAVVLGAVSRFVCQCPLLWEKRHLYPFAMNLRHPQMIEMGKLSFPLLLSGGSTQIERLTDRIFASLLPAGSLSALAFAHKIVGLQHDFLIDSFERATFPHFTKLIAAENFRALSRQLFHSLRIVFFLTLPMAVGCVVLAEVIVKAIYQRGAFDETSTRLTSQALMLYALGFPAISLSRLFNRTFFSLKDTRTPTRISVLRTIIKIALAYPLIFPFSHLGIALADSLSQIFKALYLFFLLPDQVKGQEGRDTLKSFGQTLLASTMMGIVVYLVKESTVDLFSAPLELVLLLFLGVIVYGGITFLFQGEEIHSLMKTFTTLGARYLPSKS